MADLEPDGTSDDSTADSNTVREREQAPNAGQEPADARVTVENLGGIEKLELDLSPGISLLAGENATNRSSLLRSIAAALGGHESAATLKTDSETGSVQLAIGSERYTREYTKTNGRVSRTGEPYCDQPALIDTFVALFADNPARVAVGRGEDLRELLMRPVDTDQIRREINEKRAEKSTLQSDVEQIQQEERRLPGLEEERQQLRDNLEEVESEIDVVEAEAEALEPTGDDSQEADELRETLEQHRSELRDVEDQLNTVAEKIEFRQDERDSLQAEHEDITVSLDEGEDINALDAEIRSLEREIDQLDAQRRNIQTAIEDLQTVVGINETIAEGDLDLPGIEADGELTAALDPDSQRVECWTCGTEVERDQVTERIETLRGIISDQRDELTTIEQRVSELQNEKAEYVQRREKYQDLQTRHEELTDRIELHTEQLEELQAERTDLEDEIEDVETSLAAVEQELQELDTDETNQTSEFVETHQRLTTLERERGRLESQLAETADEIEQIESLREEREQKEQRLDEVTDELEQLRGEINRLETQLVDTLNDMLAELVDRLGYQNIARVWVERKTSDVDDEGSSFELHIVREGEDGAVYEDTVDTLSESEREVIGFVVALAGYLVHDIDEEIPFILIDSVEMIDAQRLADLLRYMTEQSSLDYLITALLLKDAEAVEQTETLSETVTTHTAQFD